MNIHDATEEAFKRGYEKGKDASKEVGYWKTDMQGYVHCSKCGALAHWHLRECQLKTKYCHECGALMNIE